MGSTSSKVSTSVAGYAANWLGHGKSGPKLIQHRQDVTPVPVPPVPTARAEIDTLRQVLEERDKQVAALTHEVASANEEKRAKDDMVATYAQETEALKKRVGELQQTWEGLGKEKGVLEEQVRKHEKEKKGVELELKREKAHHVETSTLLEKRTALLETRTAELKVAQTFLTKTDTLSGAELISMVEALNGEILQNAAFMTDSFKFGPKVAEVEDDVEAAAQAAGQFIGPTLVELLRTAGHGEEGDDLMLVQIAFQTCMIEYARWTVMAWCFDNTQDERFIGIYTKILQNETQAVAGRWRALTRNHVQNVDETEMVSYLTSIVNEAFVDILILSGCKDEERHVQEMLEKLKERTVRVAKLALRLNKVVGAETTSADFEVLTIHPTTDFDTGSMQDAYGGKETMGKVLCTTELGLRRLEKVSKDGKVEWNRSLILKPKVALESVLDGMRN